MPPPPDASGGPLGPPNDFYRILTAAVADITEHGFDSRERLDYWIEQIRRAAVTALVPEHVLERSLNETMQSIYRKMIDRGEISQLHPGVGRFTIEKLRPELRAELDRRIMASANLIKLNREQAIDETIRRFSGWATSVPAGGSEVVAKRAVKTDIRKALAQLPYRERVVLTDQGHKFRAGLSDVIAKDGGAVAAIWRHHHAQYPRRAHLERDGDVFLIRDSWAHRNGLVRAAPDRFTDGIEAPGELVMCRCTYQYVYALRDVPAAMLTEKGRDQLAAARAAIVAMRVAAA